MPKKQKSGLYRSHITIGTKADGTPVYKYISGRTKAELEQAKKEAQDYYIGGTGLEADRLFGEYAVEWYETRKKPFVSESQQMSYRTMLNKYVLPQFAERNFRAIKAVDLQKFLNGFAGMSKSNITMALSCLRGIFGSAFSDRIIEFDPTSNLRKPKASAVKERRALTEDERRIVLDVIKTHEHGLYLAAMYYTGMRPGEVRGLKWGDFDFDEGLIHVQRDIDYTAKGNPVGGLKTRAADRYIPIADDFRNILVPLTGNPKDFLFTGNKSGAPLSSATAVRTWIELMLACGMAEEIPKEENKYSQYDLRGLYKPIITPYTMRHNFITMCWENGIDVLLTMKMVGHADYKTTMNIYTHLSKKHLEKAKISVNDMFAKTKVAQKLHSQKGAATIIELKAGKWG